MYLLHIYTVNMECDSKEKNIGRIFYIMYTSSCPQITGEKLAHSMYLDFIKSSDR